MMNLGANLKKLRMTKKYSQQEVADFLDIDRLTYINWENETTEIKSSYLPKLAEIYNVRIQDLFDLPLDKRDEGIHKIIIDLSDKEMADQLILKLQELIDNFKR